MTLLSSSPPQVSLSAKGARAAVIASRFNGEIVGKLVEGAVRVLEEAGADVATFWVAGALELPIVAQQAAKTADVVVCLGCIIEGGTDHYAHVCRAAVDGIMRVSIDTGVPVGNGVLTVRSVEQARERAGGSVGNKGSEAALAAIEALNVLEAVRTWA